MMITKFGFSTKAEYQIRVLCFLTWFWYDISCLAHLSKHDSCSKQQIRASVRLKGYSLTGYAGSAFQTKLFFHIFTNEVSKTVNRLTLLPEWKKNHILRSFFEHVDLILKCFRKTYWCTGQKSITDFVHMISIWIFYQPMSVQVI